MKDQDTVKETFVPTQEQTHPGQESGDSQESFSDQTKDPAKESEKDSDLEKAAQTVRQEIESWQGQFEEMRDLAQRTQAEFLNFKRRTEREKIDVQLYANEKLMSDLLPVLDNFERAIENSQDPTDAYCQGVELIFKQLQEVLAKAGLKPIEADGAPFDPAFHHAVMQVPGESPGCVAQTLQRGYTLNDRVIRPAMVKVCE